MQQIKVFDIDNDGDLDILSVSSETGIGLWRNIGWYGQFKSREIFDSTIVDGNSVSVHVQQNEFCGVDIGAFSSPRKESGTIKQNWYESQVLGCFVNDKHSNQVVDGRGCCKKLNPCSTLQRAIDNAFQMRGIRATVALASNVTIFKPIIIQLPQQINIGGRIINRNKYFVSTLKCDIKSLHDSCIYLKASKREDGKVTLHHIIFDLSQSKGSYAIYASSSPDQNYYGRPLTLRKVKFICHKNQGGGMCLFKSIIHLELSPLYMSNIHFYNLNVSSLIYLGYSDSNFVPWKNGQTYTLECNGNSEVRLPLVATHTTMESVIGKPLEWLEEGIPIVLKKRRSDSIMTSAKNLTGTIHGIIQEKNTLIRSISPLAKTYVSEGCVRFNLRADNSFEQQIPGIIWFDGFDLSVSSTQITQVNQTSGFVCVKYALTPETILIPTISLTKLSNLGVSFPAANTGVNYEDGPPSNITYGKTNTTLHFIPGCKNKTTQTFCVTCESTFEFLKNEYQLNLCKPSATTNMFNSRCALLCNQEEYRIYNIMPENHAEVIDLKIVVDDFANAPPLNVTTPIGSLPILPYKDEETKSYYINCSTWLNNYGYEAGLCTWDEKTKPKDPYNTKSRCRKTCRLNDTCTFYEYKEKYNMTVCPPRTKWNWFETNKIRCLPIQCSAGYQIGNDDRTCIPCTKGYYKITVGPVDCSACPMNSYGMTTGATSLTMGCTKCPLNSDTRNESSVGPAENVCQCRSNYYRQGNGAAMECKSCPMYSSSNEGSLGPAENACTCQANFYRQGTETAMQCLQCPSNSELTKTLGPAENACQCRSNYYRAGTGISMQCLKCPPNSNTPVNTTGNVGPAESSCQCKENFYSVGFGINMECVQCPINTNTLNKINATSLAECVCDKGFYQDPANTCQLCPELKAVCNTVGMLAPKVGKGYWRSDPTSRDLVAEPFYKCPEESICLGGNSTILRCEEGHDDNGPLCMTCKPNYVFQDMECHHCPSNLSRNSSITVFLLSGLFCTVGFAWWYITSPAMTEEEEIHLKRKLSVDVDLKTRFKARKKGLSRTEFKAIKRGSLVLTQSQIDYAFDNVAGKGSKYISEEAFEKYVNGAKNAKGGEEGEADNEEGNYKEDASEAEDQVIGTIVSKLKILLGWAQCVAYFRITFKIQWPAEILNAMNVLHSATLDLLGFISNFVCGLETNFSTKFRVHMSLYPIAVVVVILAIVVSKLTPCCRNKYTAESMFNKASTLATLLIFGLYAGVGTRIFQLYKCNAVQDKWYLEADYTIICYTANYNVDMYISVAALAVYILGIPLFQLWVLCRSRKNLYEEEAEDPVACKLLTNKYGALYLNYRPAMYFTDVVDNFRRLLLMGGLILVGENSVVQVYLGVLLCMLWLAYVLAFCPYVTPLDNTISIVLSSHMTFTLLTGIAIMAFEGRDTPSVYETKIFSYLVSFSIYLCLGIGIVSMVLTTPWLRKTVGAAVKRKLQSRKEKEKKRKRSSFLNNPSVVSNPMHVTNAGNKTTVKTKGNNRSNRRTQNSKKHRKKRPLTVRVSRGNSIIKQLKIPQQQGKNVEMTTRRVQF